MSLCKMFYWRIKLPEKKVSSEQNETFKYTKNSESLNHDNYNNSIANNETVNTINKSRKSIDDHAEMDLTNNNKNEKSINLMKNALIKNQFINNYMKENDTLNSIVEAMYSKEYPINSHIVNQGDVNAFLYVTESGHYEKSKDGRIINTFGSGVVFGDTLLYEDNSSISIKAITKCKIWAIEKRVLYKIFAKNKEQITRVIIQLLSDIIDFGDLHISDLTDVNKHVQRKYFPADELITSSSGKHDLLYVISAGAVVFKDNSNDRCIKERHRGDYFNEHVSNLRSLSIYAKDCGAECIIIDPKSFNNYLREKREIKKAQNVTSENSTTIRSEIKPEPKIVNAPKKKTKKKLNETRSNGKNSHKDYKQIRLQDLVILGTLGSGAYGRVELVQYEKNKDLTFALKCIQKIKIINEKLENNIFNERDIMYRCNSRFIATLYNTYKDDKYVYFLMEPILGGDVWNVLHTRKKLDEMTACFIAACVVEAIDYLHDRNIVYRDLKPENLMLDYKGYVKLVDFGYAKYLNANEYTQTLNGTPEYMAPEIILGQKYNRAVDYWTLGILIYELLIGTSPFTNKNRKSTYELILRGINHVDFSMSNSASGLIKKLCKPIPDERLGYERVDDIKNNNWFKKIKWDALRNGKIKAPLILPVKNNKDRRNFYDIEKSDVPPDETSGWDDDF